MQGALDAWGEGARALGDQKVGGPGGWGTMGLGDQRVGGQGVGGSRQRRGTMESLESCDSGLRRRLLRILLWRGISLCLSRPDSIEFEIHSSHNEVEKGKEENDPLIDLFHRQSVFSDNFSTNLTKF